MPKVEKHIKKMKGLMSGLNLDPAFCWIVAKSKKGYIIHFDKDNKELVEKLRQIWGKQIRVNYTTNLIKNCRSICSIEDINKR